MILIIDSCKEEVTIKPPSKLRFDFPKTTYKTFNSQGIYKTEICNTYTKRLVFNRKTELNKGDLVEVIMDKVSGKNKKILNQIVELGIRPTGIVESKESNESKVTVFFDNIESEIVVNGTKTNDVKLSFESPQLRKISQFEPFDVVEDVYMDKFKGNLELHHLDFRDSVDLNFVSSILLRNVESHKFKSDKIKNVKYENSEKRVFASKFRFSGDMATNFQFFITDSTTQCLWGQVLLDYEGLIKEGIPSDQGTKERLMDILEIEIDHFIEKFDWIKVQ